MVSRFLIPPRVVFILLWVKKGNAYEFFSHVNTAVSQLSNEYQEG